MAIAPCSRSPFEFVSIIAIGAIHWIQFVSYRRRLIGRAIADQPLVVERISRWLWSGSAAGCGADKPLVVKRTSRWLRSGPHRPLGYVWRVVDGQRQTLARRGEATRLCCIAFSDSMLSIWRFRTPLSSGTCGLSLTGSRRREFAEAKPIARCSSSIGVSGKHCRDCFKSQVGKRMIRADEPLEADEPPAEERDDDGIFQKTTRMDPSAFSCHSAATRPAGTSITNFPVREQRTVPSPRRKTESHSTRTCKPSSSIWQHALRIPKTPGISEPPRLIWLASLLGSSEI